MAGQGDRERDIPGRIAARAGRAGVVPTDCQLSDLSVYVGLLTKWNRKLNLTALLLEPLSDEAIDRLLIEPVIASSVVRRSDVRALDIGSGGGSPAIPLKVMAPGLEMVLVESRARKAAFLREVARELGLSGVNVENARFEDVAKRQAEAADLVSIRAVRAEATIWDQIAATLAPDGRVFWFRSKAAPEPEPASFGAKLVCSEVHGLGDKSELAVLFKAS